MLKADKEHLVKSKAFDHLRIIHKVKVIVLGMNTKFNKRVTMHSAMMSLMLMKYHDNETNATCLTRFKSMAQTLTIAGRAHILVSKTMLDKNEIEDTTENEIENERKKFLAMCFILRRSELT